MKFIKYLYKQHIFYFKSYPHAPNCSETEIA